MIQYPLPVSTDLSFSQIFNLSAPPPLHVSLHDGQSLRDIFNDSRFSVYLTRWYEGGGGGGGGGSVPILLVQR